MKWPVVFCPLCIFIYVIMSALRRKVPNYSESSFRHQWLKSRPSFRNGTTGVKISAHVLKAQGYKNCIFEAIFFSKEWAQKVQTFTYKRKSCSQEGNGPLTGTVVDLTCCSLSVT